MLRLRIAEPNAIPLDSHPDEIEEWRDNEGRVVAFGYQQNSDYWIHMSSLASFRFTLMSDDVIAVPHPPVQPDLIEDTYYRSILPLILQVRGQEVLHASGVLMASGVVAFCAISETGKSTLAYALSQRGYPQWADDSVQFASKGQTVQTTQLPFAVRLRPTSASFFGQPVEPSPLLAGTAGTLAQATNLLASVCILSRLPESENSYPVQVRRIYGGEALAAVLPHAYCFSLRDIERKRLMMQNYMALVMNTPVLDVRFRKGLENLSTILDAIEQSVSTTEVLGNQ